MLLRKSIENVEKLQTGGQYRFSYAITYSHLENKNKPNSTRFENDWDHPEWYAYTNIFLNSSIYL